MEDVAMEDVVTGSEGFDDDDSWGGYGSTEAEYDANRHASKDVTWCISTCDSVEAAKEFSRKKGGYEAESFWRGCTFDSVRKTCIQSSGDIYPWLDNSFGLTWVAIHGMDNSICLVTRHDDVDMACVSPFYQTLGEDEVMYALTEAITSEVEGLPYDDAFRERSGLIIKKPFGVVSVFRDKSDEETGQLLSKEKKETGQLAYDKEKAINLLMEKMKSESAITFDETIKIAISAFKHMCLEELEAEEYWVSTWEGKGFVYHLEVSDIENHLAVISGRVPEADGLTSVCD